MKIYSLTSSDYEERASTTSDFHADHRSARLVVMMFTESIIALIVGTAGNVDKAEGCILSAVDGGWSSWSPGGCSVTCGNGTETMTRDCTNPQAKHGGQPCVGAEESTIVCNPAGCPVGN